MAANDVTKKLDLAGSPPRGGTPARPAATAPRPSPRTGPFDFLQQVRDEGRKVTWPTRKETMVTTVMVFVMVIVASVFFTVADQVLRFAVSLILGIGG